MADLDTSVTKKDLEKGSSPGDDGQCCGSVPFDIDPDPGYEKNSLRIQTDFHTDPDPEKNDTDPDPGK